MTQQELVLSVDIGKIIFKTRIKQLMDRDQVLQRELSEALNITPALMSKYISGSTFPKCAKLLAFANYFNVSIDMLLGQDPLTKCLLQQTTFSSVEILRSNLMDRFVQEFGIDPLLGVQRCKETLFL